MSEQPDTAPAPVAIRVTGGNPTPEELAAATAVLQASLDELAGVHLLKARTRSAWERGRRPLRQQVNPGGWAIWGS